MLLDRFAEEYYAICDYVGENSENLFCRLEDGFFFTTGLTMVKIHGDKLMRRVTENIDRVVEAVLYKYWVSFSMDRSNYYLQR